MDCLPELIESDEQRLEVLTRPSADLVDSIRFVHSPLVVLGAGGKMGPTLAVRAQRAAQHAGHDLQIVATSRFGNAVTRDWLESRGIQTRVSDVFDRSQLAELPDTDNVVYLVGMKFGTSSDPVPTWITNTLGPLLAAERFAGAKIVALSTGNVYPLSDVSKSGSTESNPLRPMGEYANAAVARERIFQHFATSEKLQNPTTLVRLNYAHDLSYGVVSDIADKVWRGEPVDVTMGYFNAIWQGDANDVILRCFDICSSPARALNLTSPETYSVRETASRLAILLDRTPVFVGQEEQSALLSDAAQMMKTFGKPSVDFDRLTTWIAHWVKISGHTLGKATHFESRDGQF